MGSTAVEAMGYSYIVQLGLNGAYSIVLPE